MAAASARTPGAPGRPGGGGSSRSRRCGRGGRLRARRCGVWLGARGPWAAPAGALARLPLAATRGDPADARSSLSLNKVLSLRQIVDTFYSQPDFFNNQLHSTEIGHRPSTLKSQCPKHSHELQSPFPKRSPAPKSMYEEKHGHRSAITSFIVTPSIAHFSRQGGVEFRGIESYYENNQE